MGKRTGRCYLAAKHGQESGREGERETEKEWRKMREKVKWVGR